MRIRASTNSTAAQLELVRAGAGVAVLPEFSGRLTRFADAGELAFPLVAVRRAGPPQAGVTALLDVLARGALVVPGLVASK